MIFMFIPEALILMFLVVVLLGGYTAAMSLIVNIQWILFLTIGILTGFGNLTLCLDIGEKNQDKSRSKNGGLLILLYLYDSFGLGMLALISRVNKSVVDNCHLIFLAVFLAGNLLILVIHILGLKHFCPNIRKLMNRSLAVVFILFLLVSMLWLTGSEISYRPDSSHPAHIAKVFGFEVETPSLAKNISVIKKDYENIPNDLISSALAAGSCDNVTVVAVEISN